MSKTKKQSSKTHSLKKESSKETDLSIKSLIDNDNALQLIHITYNKKPFGYFLLGYDILYYYGERKIKYNNDNTNNTKNKKLNDKECITIYFHKNKSNNYEYAHLADFFYTRKNELCLTKKNIKPADMFPLFDIFMQELKVNTFELRDASTLHLKYCNYRLGLFGLLEKNYTYYNKFGFFPTMKEKPKTQTPDTQLPETQLPETQTPKNKKTKKIKTIIKDVNKPIKLTPIGRTTRKILKAATDLKNIKLKEILHILEHYHYDMSNDYRLGKTKEILFDNLSESISYRIKDIITIYNKANPKEHYKYSYTQLLHLTFKEFLSEFILFFCNYRKDTIRYVEEVNYITNALQNFITLFRRKPINKIHRFNKLYYYGKESNNTMTAFDMSTKKFIIKPCPQYDISINKNSEKKIIEIVINDIEGT